MERVVDTTNLNEDVDYAQKRKWTISLLVNS